MQFDYDREVEAVPAIMPGSAHDYFRVTIDRQLAIEMYDLVSFGTVLSGFQGLRDSARGRSQRQHAASTCRAASMTWCWDSAGKSLRSQLGTGEVVPAVGGMVGPGPGRPWVSVYMAYRVVVVHM